MILQHKKEIQMRLFGLSTTRGLMSTTLAAAAMMLGLSGAARADNECALKELSLRGTYVFAARGFTIVGGVAQPKAIVEVISFNGDGTLTVPAFTRSINGTIGKSTPGVVGTGSYTVEMGCTGTISFTGGPSFDIFVSSRWDTIWMMQTNQDTVLQGIATKR
jgi:hypothetical protein